jgi:hypothetical protein
MFGRHTTSDTATQPRWVGFCVDDGLVVAVLIVLIHIPFQSNSFFLTTRNILSSHDAACVPPKDSESLAVNAGSDIVV